MARRMRITRKTRIEDILDRYPHAVAVLDEFGVYFDPFTYVNLKATVEEAAGYNAVKDHKAFLHALQKAVDNPPPKE
ncbi:MAG: hypothetical protein HYZ68_06635 [Chloroflexi bacterium]|nr:hypothetical protein [Chloroflexota bacterium]